MSKKYSFCLTIPKNRGDYAIFSLPQTNYYQVISNLTVKPSDNEVIKIIKGNRVAIFRPNKITINFQICPKVFKNKINDNWSLADYKNNHFECDRIVSGNNLKIKQIVKEAIGKEKNLNKIVFKLYDFALDYLVYGNPIDGLYTYKQAMEKRIIDCGGYSTFLMSLFQSVNIPTRLVSGFLIKNNLLTKLCSTFDFCPLTFNFLSIHAWLEAQLPDKTWFPMDPSIEWRRRKNLTKRKGGFGYIPNDRLVVSFGKDFKLKINNKIYKIDILQKPINL